MEGLFQPQHLLIILLAAIVLFGPKKIPELGKGLGEGIRGFKDAMKSASETPAASTATTSAATEEKKVS